MTRNLRFLKSKTLKDYFNDVPQSELTVSKLDSVESLTHHSVLTLNKAAPLQKTKFFLSGKFMVIE